MSEGINFDITAQDKTAAGVQSAVSNISKLAGIGKDAAEAVGGASEAGVAGLAKWAQVAAVAGTVITTVITTTKKAYEFSKEGAQLDRLQTSFSNVASSYGTSSNAILLSMRAASRGTIADTDIMMAANRAMLLGVSTNADELGKITEVAIARGKAMGLTSAEAIDRVYTGIGRLSPKILDDLGIVTNATQKYEEYAKAHGIAASAIDDMTKREIIKKAIIEGSSDLVKKSADDDAASYERIQAAWTNYQNSLKLQMAGTFTAPNNFIAGILQNAANAQNASLNYGNYLKNFAGTTAPVQVRGMQESQQDRANRFQAMMNRASAMTSGLKSQYGISDGRNTPEQFAAGKKSEGAGGFAQDMQMSLEGGLALTDMTAKYSAKTAELNTKLAEEQATLADLARRGYPETSDKVTEHTDKVNALRQAITDNNAAQVSSQKDYAMSVLKAKDASVEQQMAFAVASGKITQGAANQELAQQRIADAFISGSVSATAYATQIAAVMKKVQNMDGKHANAYIDVWIREHNLGANAAATQNTAVVKHEGQQNGQITGRALGGMLNMNGWTLVGDRPGGVLTPYSELISPWGYVYDAKMTKKLIESGAVQTMNSRAQSGEIGGYSSRGKSTKSSPFVRAKGAVRQGSHAATAGSLDIATASVDSGSGTQSAAQQMQVQMQQQAINATMENTSTLNEILSVLKVDNPRAIGKEVGNKLAKFS